MDQVIQKKSPLCFWRITRKRPGALALPDGIPCPERLGVDGFHPCNTHLDPCMMRDHPRPVASLQSDLIADRPRHIERVLGMDLAKPGILAVPGMIHGGGALCDGVQRIFPDIDGS